MVADAARPRTADVDGLVGGSVDWVGEDGMDVVGTIQVVIALRVTGDEVAALATPGAGMTGSGGAAIALVTAPTPTQLTTVAAAVATTQAAIGRGVTRRIQRFSPLQSQVRTKAMINRKSRSLARAYRSQDELVCHDAPRPAQVPRHGHQDDANPARD